MVAEYSHSLHDLFEGSGLFLDLLLKQALREDYVLCRTYSNGTWYQLSGRDFCAHLGRAVDYWRGLLQEDGTATVPGRSVIFVCRNSYNSMVAAFAAVLCGYDAMHAPAHMAKNDIAWCLKYFKGVAVVTDIEELAKELSGLPVSVINIANTSWMPQDKHPEPPLLALYREYKSDSLANVDKLWRTVKVGRFAFVSFGHDGFQKPEILKLDALVVNAQNFSIHSKVPKNIFWKSIELLSPGNPFAHLSRFCILVKNGVMGFPNPSTDWETNLRILRPTFLFSSVQELNQVCVFVNEVAQRKTANSRVRLSRGVDKISTMLSSKRAMKIPESTLDMVRKNFLLASRWIAGKEFLREALEDLRFIVHGLAPSQEGCVLMLEKLGLPVIETYGTTQAAGMLSSNTFHSPKLHSIGSPLPHVNFRLGENSTLEYRISSPAFEGDGGWLETGDAAQMTPYGFLITGRKKHLFVTLGGVVVSPVRLEQILKENSMIAEACVVGDKMPYLSVLLVLSPTVDADYRRTPQDIRERVQEMIGNINETLPRNVTLKKFLILDKPFSESGGEKLSNGEINRLKIQETRADLIASLYR